MIGQDNGLSETLWLIHHHKIGDMTQEPHGQSVAKPVVADVLSGYQRRHWMWMTLSHHVEEHLESAGSQKKLLIDGKGATLCLTDWEQHFGEATPCGAHRGAGCIG